MKEKKLKKISKHTGFTPVKFTRGDYLTGFTLVEIIVSITVFSLIFGIVSGIFVSAIKAQRKSLVSQELLSQTSYVMGYMSQQLRMAKNYTMSSANCTSAGYNYELTHSGNGIKFASYENPSCCWEFYLEDSSKRLIREITCGVDVNPQFLTADNFAVEMFKIYLIDGFGLQPRIVLFLKMKSTSEQLKEQPTIEIQTTISQRILNE